MKGKAGTRAGSSSLTNLVQILRSQLQPLQGSNLSNYPCCSPREASVSPSKDNEGRLQPSPSTAHPTTPTGTHSMGGNYWRAHFLREIVSIWLFHLCRRSQALTIDSDMSSTESHFHPCHWSPNANILIILAVTNTVSLQQSQVPFS